MDKGPVPPHQFVAFPFAAYQTLSVDGTTPAYFGTSTTINLNSIYDPGFGTGSALGFDQFCPALYSKFKVYNCEVRITFFDPSSEGVIGAISVSPPGVSHTLAGFGSSEVEKYPFTATTVLNNTGKQEKTMRMKLDIGEISGLTHQQFRDEPESFSGSSSANPSNMPQLRVAVASARNTASTTCMVRIDLKYWAMLYERVTISP